MSSHCSGVDSLRPGQLRGPWVPARRSAPRPARSSAPPPAGRVGDLEPAASRSRVTDDLRRARSTAVVADQRARPALRAMVSASVQHLGAARSRRYQVGGPAVVVPRSGNLETHRHPWPHPRCARHGYDARTSGVLTTGNASTTSADASAMWARVRPRHRHHHCGELTSSRRAVAASSAAVVMVLRWVSEKPRSITAAGVPDASPARSRPAMI